METYTQGIGIAALIVGLLVLPFLAALWAWRRGARKLAVTFALVGAVFWIAQLIPSPRASPLAKQNACIANLKQLAEAKRSWATLTKPETSTAAQPSDLAPYLKQGQLPICPTDGTYTLGAVNEPPRCSHADKGHAIR